MKALQYSGGSLQEVSGVPVLKSGTSTGTGSSQEITTGFNVIPKEIQLIPLESGVGFSDLVPPSEGSEGHFHITVTTGKSWGWIAVLW